MAVDPLPSARLPRAADWGGLMAKALWAYAEIQAASTISSNLEQNSQFDDSKFGLIT